MRIVHFLLAAGALLSCCIPNAVIAQNEIRDINVQADYWLSSSPDFARVTILVEENGASAIAVGNSLENRKSAIIKAVTSKNQGIIARARGAHFEGIDGAQAAITPSGVLHAFDHVAFETTNISQVPSIIEEALKAGATNTTEVNYYVRNDQQKRLAAIKAATDLAKEKALIIAQSLGEKLGALQSINIQEDDGGALILEQRMNGENPTQYRDKDIRVVVNARYAIAETEGAASIAK